MRGLFFLAALFVSLSSTAQSILVKPVILNFKAKQGETQTKSITVANNLDKPMQFKLYVSSWERDTTGAHIYMDSANIHSCSSWITLDKDFLELAPKSATEVSITMKLPNTPEAAERMKWAMLFIEDVKETKTVNTTTKGFSTVINNAFRIGVHLYQTPPFAIHKDVQIVSFKPVPQKPGSYRLVCVNKGNTMVECKGNMEINSLADGSKTEAGMQTFPMFPDQKRFVDFTLPANLSKGKYALLGSVDSGEDAELQAVQATVEVN